MIKYIFISKKNRKKNYSEVPPQKALKKLSTFEIKWKFCVSGRIKYVTHLERGNGQFPEKKRKSRLLMESNSSLYGDTFCSVYS